MLTFSEYQKQTRATTVYPSQFGIIYTALGLGNEAGEVLGKIKKVIRDNNGIFSDEHREKIIDEISDTLWYLAALAFELGYDLGDVAQRNLDKLADRAKRGVIKGSGDNR